MSRLQSRFAELKEQNRAALVTFVTAGDPDYATSLAILKGLPEAGADVIELGMPFTDPMADGPAIQLANIRALAAKQNLSKTLQMVREFRETNASTPLVLMGYYNPIFAYGVERFVADAKEAGVDGLIVVDYPPEESESFSRAALARGIDPIFLLAPTSTESRVGQVLSLASGYVYYVSLKGITGGTLDREDVRKRVAAIKARTALPIGVGFGIRDAETACAVAESSDAVIIGTRLIQVLEEGDPAGAAQRVGEFIGGIRRALDERFAAAARA